MTKARGSSWLTPAPVDPLVCRISWKSRGSGRGGEPARNQVDLACHELPLPPPPSLPPTLGRPSLAHSLRRTHSPPASLTPSSLLSSTALPFRLAANNTRNNSRCSTSFSSHLCPLFINPCARVLNACLSLGMYVRPCDLCASVWPHKDSRVRESKRTSKRTFVRV